MRLLSTQRAINAHLAALKPPEELVPGVIQSICETLDWSFGAFWVPVRDSEDELEVRAIWHRPSPLLERFAEVCRETRFSPGEGMLGTILQTREPAWLPDLQTASVSQSKMAVPAELRGVFGFPLAIGDTVHGVLEFISEETREPDPALLADFQLVGMQLAQYLDRWDAHHELTRHDEEARQVIDSLAEGVVVMDAEGRVTSFNDAARRMLDFDPAAVRGQSGVLIPVDGVFLEDGTPLTEQNSLVRHVLDTREPLEGVLVRTERDGNSRWFEVNLRPLPGGGVVSSTSDVTERRMAEEGLRASEARKTAMLEAALDSVITMDRDGRVVEFNPAAERTFGYAREEVVGRELSELIIPPSVRERHRSGLSRFLEGRRGMLIGRRVELRGIRADGSEFPLELALTCVETGDGPVFTGFIRDLTSRHEAEEEQRRLAAIVASTDDAILSKDRNQLITSWNAGAERLYGYTAEEAVGHTIHMLVPPERRGEEREILDRVLHEEGVTRFETQRVRKDGTVLDVAITASPVRDRSGKVIGASVIARDITKRKSAERALREERDRAEHYLHMAHSIIVAIDRNERATMINRTGLDILGRTEAEMLSSNWFDLVVPEDVRESLRQAFRDVISGRRIDEGELGYFESPVITAGGERRTITWKTTLMRDARGRVGGILTSGTDITERLKNEQAIAHLAYHDQLTGLPNRALLEEHLEIALARAAREGHELALLYLDLDNFKMVNDSLGHAAGDRLLEMVAERLSGITRTSDLIARHGGDEFLVLLTDLEGGAVTVAETVAGKILAALEEPFTVGEAVFEIAASVGVAIFPRDGESTPALLRAADAAMYQAKAGGRNRYAVHRFEVDDHRDLLSTTARLRRALAQDEFVLHYQPIYSVPDGRLASVEALLRWNDPVRGLVGPTEFIQLAEDTGLIEPIGEWVIRAISQQAKDWQHQNLGVPIHFNLSPRQLRQRAVVESIKEVIHESGVAPELLTAEITESAAMAEGEGGQSMLAELRAFGLHLSVDDFGSGYSSLGRLSQLPVDVLKLDRSFLRGVPHDPDAGALVRGVIDLANGLGMETVVEGVETPAQWEFLSAHGRLFAQGFHLARPAPPEEITLMLEHAHQVA